MTDQGSAVDAHQRPDRASTRLPRWLLIALTVWLALQLGRLIAIPLIHGVAAGTESPVWMFPALIDVVVAAACPVVVGWLWLRRTPMAWLMCWTCLVVSVLDHASAITATVLAGNPRVFTAMFDLPADGRLHAIVMGPGSQTLIDLAFIVLLCRRQTRTAFGLSATV